MLGHRSKINTEIIIAAIFHQFQTKKFQTSVESGRMYSDNNTENFKINICTLGYEDARS